MLRKEELPKTVGAFFWHFLRQKKLTVFCLLMAVLLWSMRSSLNPLFIGEVINGVSTTDATSIRGLSDVPMVIWLPVLLFFINQNIAEFAQLWREYIEIRFLPWLKSQMRREVYAHALKHSPSYFQDHFAGAIANRVSILGSGVLSLNRTVSVSFVGSLFTLFFTFFALMYVGWFYALIMLVWLGIYFSFIAVMGKRIIPLSRIYAGEQTRVHGHMVDGFTNIFSIKYFSRDRHEINNLRRHLGYERVEDKRLHRYFFMMSFLMKNSTTVIMTAMLVKLLFDWWGGTIHPGDFATVMILSFDIGHRAHVIADALIMIYIETGRIQESLNLINVKHGLVDKTDAKPLTIETPEISYRNIGFAYDGTHRKVFDGLNIDIKAGEKVGLVGVSGAGKSSFVNLLLRFYDVQSGEILIDGHDISGVTQESLRAHISFIPQDTMLFHRSLKENIRYGRLEASDDEVLDAARKAHADEFISRLSKGYDTLVGERGVKLSGGQRQRIAIARAILKDAPILVLDEATSALDSESEKLIQQSLVDLMRGKTVIAIAHRLSTISNLDRILVFDEGRIIEQGTHDELIAKGGQYAKLWSMQSGGFLPG